MVEKKTISIDKKIIKIITIPFIISFGVILLLNILTSNIYTYEDPIESKEWFDNFMEGRKNNSTNFHVRKIYMKSILGGELYKDDIKHMYSESFVENNKLIALRIGGVLYYKQVFIKNPFYLIYYESLLTLKNWLYIIGIALIISISWLIKTKYNFQFKE